MIYKILKLTNNIKMIHFVREVIKSIFAQTKEYI